MRFMNWSTEDWPGRSENVRPGVLLLVVAAVLMAGCSLFPKENDLATPPLTIPEQAPRETFTVRLGPIADKVSLRATVAPAREANLYYREGGRVKTIHVNAGDAVRAGQVLLELDTGDTLFALQVAEIGLRKAQVALDAARAGAGNLTEYDLVARELDVELADLQVRRLKEHVAQSRLAAPFSGQVVAVNVRLGDLVAAYQPAIRLADPSELVIDAEVSEGDLIRLAVNQRVQVDFSELSGATGVIVQLPEPGAAAPGTPKRARIRLDKPDPKAVLGLSGKVHVILEEKPDALLLPKAAVRQFSGRSYVLMQTAEGKREVDVVTGIQGETEVEIVRGVKAGDQVIGR